MRRVYLAGPINGLTVSQATAWRNHAALLLEYTDFECIDPLRGKISMHADGDRLMDGYDNLFSDDKSVIARDLYDIDRADVLLLNTRWANSASLGSLVELGYAKCRNIPIVTVIDNEGPWAHSAWVRVLSTFIAESLEDATDIIRTL